MTPRPVSIYDVWKDQADFNRLFRPTPPETFEERSAVTREMVLHLIAQATQLLECTDWRTHRNKQVRQNDGQIRSQLADIHKYYITLCQIWGLTHEDTIDDYWKKSMVCRQRYAEEWVRSIQEPTVILDLDNVLCDYITGFGAWLLNNVLLTPNQASQVRTTIQHRKWLDARAVGMDPGDYQMAKHRFRTCGAKSVLPPMPGAQQFVAWCRARGWQIVILTSRPITEYPNLYTDTLLWLEHHGMAPDFVWWGADKGEKLIDRKMVPYVQFVVDDDIRYAMQYAELGVRTYWLTSDPNAPDYGPAEGLSSLYVTPTLETIVEVENVRRQGTSTAR